jgi:hypothetical protein
MCGCLMPDRELLSGMPVYEIRQPTSRIIPGYRILITDYHKKNRSFLAGFFVVPRVPQILVLACFVHTEYSI